MDPLNADNTYFNNRPKRKESCLKRLCAINVQHVRHLRKELVHGLYITLVNLFHQCIQRLTSCTTHFCSIGQELKVTSRLYQLQYVVAPERICKNKIIFQKNMFL